MNKECALAQSGVWRGQQSWHIFYPRVYILPVGLFYFIGTLVELSNEIKRKEWKHPLFQKLTP
jgi:hypothetical protein